MRMPSGEPGKLFEVSVDHLRNEWKGRDVGIDHHTRTEPVSQPPRIAFFGKRTVDQLQSVVLGDSGKGSKEVQPVLNRKLPEETTRIDDLVGMYLKVAGARSGERTFRSLHLKRVFHRQPLFFWNDKRTEHKNRLAWVGQIVAGVAGLVEVDKVHLGASVQAVLSGPASR